MCNMPMYVHLILYVDFCCFILNSSNIACTFDILMVNFLNRISLIL